ncbi:MAG: hypothetical protein AWU55_2357 [Halomonadaceae bacterium T82-2]|nr:MAG: hypothetical protein AWU55_2357 [Halomonadaceae bacterium T82-2]
MADAVRVEVAFALPQRQVIVPLTLPPGTSAREAVRRAHLESHFADLPTETFSEAELGIFGRRLDAPEQYTLTNGDRVELYRPLRIDPKQARRLRAARKR